MAPRNQDQFSEILDHAEDITERFFVDFGGLSDDVLNNAKGVRPHLHILREHLMKHILDPQNDYSGEPGLVFMEEWSRLVGNEVSAALRDGNVVAVDGTPVINHQAYLTGEVFSCAIGTLTSRHEDVSAHVVKTYLPIEREPKTLDDVIEDIDTAESFSESRSWPMAFMEYMERAYALASDASIALIDGPIVTQNLVTRPRGRELLTDMIGNNRSKRCIGVIKDTHKSDRYLRFFARALRTGELYVHHTVYHSMYQRLETSYAGEVQRFVEEQGRNVLRGVYKPGIKAFGFECHIEDLPYAVALLWLDRNQQPGFEIPFLLAQVDARIRSRYRPNETTEAINAALVRNGEEDYFDEADERDLR